MTVLDEPPPPTEADAPPDDVVVPITNGKHGRNGTPARIPPHDTAAETSLLGACILNPDAINHGTTLGLTAASFYKPAHGHVWDALVALHAAGQPTDPVTLADHLHRNGLLDAAGGRAALADHMTSCPAISSAPRYASIVAEHARMRRLIKAAAEIADLAYSLPDDVDKAEQTALTLVTPTTGGAHTHDAWIELDAFIDTDEPDHDWIVPGLLEHADRCIVTATPGAGKSTLLRQIGVMVASGLHPFTGDHIDPQRVLIIDVENSSRQIRREIRPLRDAAGTRYNPGMLELRVYGEAINLADPATLADIQRHVDHYQPAIICTGPLYKLIGGDPVTEKDARPVADAFDKIRHVCGSAVIIEAHSPYPVGKTRVIRPYGASLWERWPEFGWYFSKAGDIEHWRGQREQRDWPARIERSKPWPWAAAAAPARTDAEEWHGPTKCVEAVIDFLQRHPDEKLTGNQLYTRLRADNPAGRGFREQTVREAAEIAAGNGDVHVENGPRKARLFSAKLDDSNHENEELF